MRVRLVFAAFAILGSASPAFADAVCKPELAASIDLTIGPNAISALAPVSLNGEHTFFAVDTGGIVSTLRYDVAERLNLPMEDAPYQMVNVAGQRLDRQATVRRFDLGALQYASQKLMLEPEYDLASGLHGSISGTLSPDILRKFDVEFDLAAAKLNLFTPSTCPTPAYWNPTGAAAVKMEVQENGHVVFPMSLDGKPIQTMLDTGMSVTAIDMVTARDKFGVDLNSGDLAPVGRLSSNPDEGVLYRYQFKSLAIANTPIRVEKPNITLMPDLSGSEPPEDHLLNHAKLILGLSTMQHLHLYIAYKRQMLYVTPASGAPAIHQPESETESKK